MQPGSHRPWLSFDTSGDYARAREIFHRAGYSVDGIRDRLGIQGLAILPNSEALLVRRTSSNEPLDILIRLFIAGALVPVKDVQRALRPMDLEQWIRSGLLEEKDGSVAATVKLLPSGDWVVAFDRRDRGTPHSPDMVLGISNATLTLINFTARRTVRRTLDLGTGCGIQAFFASVHSDQVVAVDRNPRAIRFADFNARLNGIANVECLEGDRFEPVTGQEFDLVVCNAPFVISPASGYVSLDGGMSGDQFCRSIARDVLRHLAEDGMCQMLCNWAHFSGRDWKEYLAGWFEPYGCDVWVIRSRKDDAANYARLWIQEIHGENSPDFDRLVSEWMDYYEREGIEEMSMGLVNVRRTNRKTHVRIDDAPEIIGSGGDDIARLFELRDFLHTVADDDRLLETRLCASEKLRLEHQYQSVENQWQVTSSRLFLTQGFAYSVNTDRLLSEFLVRCNGQATVRDALNGAGRALGTDLTETVPDCLRVIRRCIELGFLLPEGFPVPKSGPKLGQ